MNNPKIPILFISAIFFISAGCNNQPEPEEKPATPPAAITKPDNRVGKAVEGAVPASSDNKEDMAKIISKTKQNEIETAAARKERDQDLIRIEQEKISNTKQ